MKRGRLATKLAALALISTAIAPGTASAEHDRAGVAGLTGSASSAHFVIHYDPAGTPVGAPTMDGYAQARVQDLEQAYGRLVTGGGESPNAGLRAPTPDADGKTDVYLTRPPSASSSFSGGRVVRDGHGTASSYVYMTPDLSAVSFRFVGAHEFMHVLQNGYTFGRADLLFEGFANWAAEFATDIDPLDNNFARTGSPTGSAPWLPLDCIGTWEGHDCDGGYWQWLFIQRQVEAYGPAFVSGFYDAFAASSGFGNTMTLMDAEIGELSGGAANLRTRFASYARDVWDPERWQTTALRGIHDWWTTPNATRVDRSTADTGTQSHSVDHLATRYLQVVNDGGFEPTGPDDQVRISLNRPPGLASSSDLLERVAGTPGLVDRTGPGGAGPVSITRSFDAAETKELIVPLTNDTTGTDDLSFGYRVEFLPGTPTPPANDTLAGAARARLGRVAATDNVYAGGRGADELPGTECDSNIGDATRGVWYRFTAPTSNRYGFDARDSDFPSVISLHRESDGGFRGCSLSGDLNIAMNEGDSVDVYVGRRAGRTDIGSDAQLLVTGPAGPAPETTITAGPADGSSSDRARHSFEFAATGSFPEFECRIDGAAWSACVSPRTFSRLNVGQHTFEVRAIAGGSTDTSPASRTFTIRPPANDDLADAVSVRRAGAVLVGHTETADAEAGEPAHGGSEAGASVWYRWRAQGDGDATVETCRDAGSFDTTLGVYQGAGLGDLVEVAGNDDACGEEGLQSRVEFPVGAGETYWIAVDGYEGLAKSFGRPRFVRSRGDFELTITGPEDSVAPIAGIASGPSGTERSRTASFEFSIDEDAGQFECRLDASGDPTGFRACPGVHELSGLADGVHTLDVRAVDLAGNRGPIASRTWTVDATAPTVQIASGPSGSTAARDATFTYAADDAAATFECSLDGTGFAPCTAGGQSYGGLSDGGHSFRVRAVDPAGNVGAAAERSWTIAQPQGGGGGQGPGATDPPVSPDPPAQPDPPNPPDLDPDEADECAAAKAALAKAKAKLKKAKTPKAKSKARAKVKKAKQRVKAACG